jgi:hypothetical protein
LLEDERNLGQSTRTVDFLHPRGLHAATLRPRFTPNDHDDGFPEEHRDAWLSGQLRKEILLPFLGEKMKTWAISPRVNSPMNNDPGILV